MVEAASTAAPWRLCRLGRYAHAAEYVGSLAAASGLHLLFLREECVRLEGRAPVGGLIVGFQKGTP
jgi:predicted TPR repeat methyltransferase